MESLYSRTELLIGKRALNKLKESKVCVFGVGGVGGYVVECLARAGVGELTLVDFDKISLTNLNRQIISLTKNVGKFKVDEFKKRIKDINNEIKVKIVKQKLCKENIETFNLQSFDFIVDAIDDVKAKVELAFFATKNNLKIISAMGSGNKYQVPNFYVCDIFKTEGDKLAKKMRAELKKCGVKNLPCVFSKDLPVELENKSVIASISYYPASAGITMAAYVINKLIEDKVC